MCVQEFMSDQAATLAKVADYCSATNLSRAVDPYVYCILLRPVQAVPLLQEPQGQCYHLPPVIIIIIHPLYWVAPVADTAFLRSHGKVLKTLKFWLSLWPRVSTL